MSCILPAVILMSEEVALFKGGDKGEDRGENDFVEEEDVEGRPILLLLVVLLLALEEDAGGAELESDGNGSSTE